MEPLRREKVLAGELLMVTGELRSLDLDARKRVMKEIGAKTCRELLALIGEAVCTRRRQ